MAENLKKRTFDEIKEILENDNRAVDVRGNFKPDSRTWYELEWIDLSASDLRDMELCESDLRKTNLNGSDMRDGLFCQNDMRWSSLHGCDMREADLRDSDLRECDLSGSNMQESILSGCNLSRTALRDCDLRRCNLSDCNLSCSSLGGSDLTGANLSESDLHGCYLTGCDLSHASLRGSCWPLWSGSYDVIVDKQIAAQLAYHFCRLICDDDDVKVAQRMLAPLANKFRGAWEDGLIKEDDVNPWEEKKRLLRQLEKIDRILAEF